MYTLTSYSRNSIPSSPLLREHNKIELGVAKHFVTWAQKLQLRLFHYYSVRLNIIENYFVILLQ